MSPKLIALFALLSTLELVWPVQVATKAHPGRKVVCYFGSWSVYRAGAGKFDVETIDPFMCTHLIFGFTGLRNGTNVALDPYNDLCEEWGKGALARFTSLKKVNKRLKTLVAIGGWNEGSAPYSEMAKTSTSRQIFISSVVDFLKKYDFDGFDLDWEYPTLRGGNPEDKVNFGLLVKEMREAFVEYGYTLSAAVGAGEATIVAAYDVPTIASNLDFINVMTYDFHGAWEEQTGHNAPLYMNPLDKGKFDAFNVNHSINFWVSQGAPREKLILGMGLYGRGMLLDKESENGLYAPAKQPISPGPYLRDPGYWGYNEICEAVGSEKGWTIVVDEYYKAPYAYKGRLWIGYDDVQSIKLKSEYIIANGLGGGMVWSLDTDDVSGKCHGERFPLIKTIYRTVIGKYPEYTWEPAPSRSTSKEVCKTGQEETVSNAPAQNVLPTDICKSEGLNEDPEDCTKFYNCVVVNAAYQAHPQNCASGTAFNPQSKSCAYIHEVPNCNIKPFNFMKQSSF